MKINTLDLGEALANGAEHRVYRYGTDRVVKVPAPWASLWQTMSAELAQRDVTKLAEAGIHTTPTEVLARPRVKLPDGSEEVVPYAFIQPFLEARPVRVDDLQRDDVAEAMEDLFARSQDLYRREGLGVDFVGFATLTGLLRTFFRGKVDVAIHNVLMLDGQTPDVQLCDTRLYDRDGFRLGTKETLFAALNLQHEMVGHVLAGVGRKGDCASTAWLPKLVGKTLYELTKARL